MSANEKIVLIGAGSASFTRGIVRDLLARKEEAELALVDISPEALAVAEGLTRKMIDARHAPIRLRASVDRRQVLRGATAVICTIGVGGRRAWEQDILIPRKHGIYQPVGDSVMPGGTSRALRMIPAMVDIAKDVLDLAPQAIFINYGNPMAAVCRGVRKATGADIVGLCHGVFSVAKGLARVLGVPEDNLRYTAVGINHLTWFSRVRANGEDCMPRLLQIAEERVARYDRASPVDDSGAEGLPAEDLDPLCWHLLKLFGAFPAVQDRHVSEFFPQLFRDGMYSGKRLGMDVFDIQKVIDRGDRVFESMREAALSSKPLGEEYFQKIGGEHEQALEIIDSIRTDAGRVYSVNLPNLGQVPNLPPEAVIECPAVANGVGIRPIVQEPLPSGVMATLATRLAWVETIVEAAMEASRTKFVQALVVDGWVSSMSAAERLADAMLAAQAEHLPQFAGAQLRSASGT